MPVQGNVVSFDGILRGQTILMVFYENRHLSVLHNQFSHIIFEGKGRETPASFHFLLCWSSPTTSGVLTSSLVPCRALRCRPCGRREPSVPHLVVLDLVIASPVSVLPSVSPLFLVQFRRSSPLLGECCALLPIHGGN